METVHVGHVRLYEYGLVCLGDFVKTGGRLLAGHLVQIGHHNVGPFPDQFTGDALTESLGSSGHDYGLPFDASSRSCCSNLAAIVFHLPVVNEGNLAGGHRMLASETGGIPGDLHGIHEYVRYGLGLLGVGADSHKTDSLDEQHLRSVAALLDVSLDLPFSLLHKILGILRINEYVLTLAVDNTVRSEGLKDGCSCILALDEAVDQRIVGHFQSLEPAASPAEDRPDCGDCLADAVADWSLAFRDRLHQRFQFGHDSVVDSFDLLNSVSSDEDTVVLEEYDCRVASVLLPVFLDLVVHLLEKGVAGIRVWDVQCIREEMGAQGLSILAAHQSIDKGRMEMDHEGCFHAIVQGSLY